MNNENANPIINFLTIPSFANDAERTRLARLLALILLVAYFGTSANYIFGAVTGSEVFNILGIFLLVGLGIALFVAWIAVKQGYVEQTAWATVIVLFLVTTVQAFQQGLRGIYVLNLVTVVAYATALLGARGALIFGSLTFLLSIGLGAGEAFGLINAPSPPITARIVLSVLGVIQIGLVLFLQAQSLLSTLADTRRQQNELAVRNTELDALSASLEQRVTDRTRALETAYAVSREVGRARNTEELFRTVAELLKESFDYYHVHAYLLDAEQGRLLMRGGTGEAGATMLARGHSLALGQGLVGRAAETGVPVLVPDVTDNPDWLPNPLLPDTKSEVAVPIREGDRIVGVIDVQQDRAFALGQEDAELLQSIAVQVGVVLRNLQNLEQTEQVARREALVIEISQRIQATTSIDEALQVTARELGRALNGAPTHVVLAPEREN